MIALRSRLKTSILISAVGLMIIPATDLRGQEAKRSIEQVKGDVYRFQNDFHFAMFVVTDDGIVVTDPINADAVNWLKAELADRFDQPVTHMVLSHYHADHASGGEAWGDIEVIAHENAKVHIEAGEVQTAMPTETFADQHTFSLGGKDFELTYLGEGHSDDLIAMVVRPENVAFVVDVVSPKSVPWRDFPHTDINGMIEQIKTVEALDFEIMAPGHSVIGTKQDATDVRVYIEEMRDAVKAALAEGQSEAKLDLDPEDAPLHREMLDLACETLEDIAMVEAGRGRLVFITPACATPSGSDPASLAIDTALAGAISTAANAGAAGGAAGEPSWARNRLRQLRAAGSHMSRAGI